jgi:thiol:disulfide interchange protein DsbD
MPEAGVVAYSPEALAQLRRDGRVVFVNMTADWCVTCKANERTVLDRDGFRAALDAAGAVYMKGDWTDVDPAITAFLESHGAVGVPLYVVYPRQGEPKVLPTVLTADTVAQALAEAAR